MSDTHDFANEYARPDAATVQRDKATYARFGKRVFDVFLALLLLPVLAPFIVLFWCLARLDGGPGLFAHTRIGRNGKMFRCWKIRTMVRNAEACLQSHLSAHPKAATEWRLTFKLANDPRITGIGNFLRRTGLDELPQIWNVLRGDMSFVGPRPVTKPELSMYGADQSAYLALRPGVTGMWQVYGRNSGNYANRVRLDRGYLDGISLKSDISLIVLTAFGILRMTGS